MRRDDPLWARYEMSAAILLRSMDTEPTEVLHDQRVQARLSSIPRQVDVLARGRVIGQDILIAVECKRHGRPANVGTIDAFIGKLLDMGAHRSGIMYL
jgi:hypothetical protein